MPNWCLEVWGDFACFTRPEMKVERVSYDVMTPSAARAIFEAILWKPEIRWNITKIEVMNPIRWISLRRNELGRVVARPTESQISGSSNPPMGIFIEDERQQRAGLFLRDVRYRIHGYFDVVEPNQPQGDISRQAREALDRAKLEAKYAAMFERRARSGQCFHRPYLGCREFACYFRLVDPEESVDKPIKETRDLGYMLYDLDFERDPNNPPPLFFRAYMENGVIITDRQRVEVRG